MNTTEQDEQDAEIQCDNDWLKVIQSFDWGGEISLAEGNEAACEGRREIIWSIHEQFEKLRKEIAIAKYQAECIFKAHAPQCTLLPDLNGVISQISNMTTGMVMKEQVKPLVEALQMLHAKMSEECNVFFEQDGKPIDICTDLGEAYQESELCEKTCDALSSARTIGIPVGVNAPVAATPDQFDNHPKSETKDEQL
jgi:hypothetical protein